MLSCVGSKIALFIRVKVKVQKSRPLNSWDQCIYHVVWFIILLNSWAIPSKIIQLGKQMYKKTTKGDFKKFYNIK